MASSMDFTSRIADITLGPKYPCFVIAEIGVNHNGDLERARALIDAAAQAGADAVKFQSFVSEQLVTPYAPKAHYQVETTGQDDESQLKMLQALEFDESQHRVLKDHAEECGLMYLCTPYEHESLAMLVRLRAAAIKVASTDATNIPFLKAVAQHGRPVLLSTGMCTLAEVAEAVTVLEPLRRQGRLTLLHCTSEYPAPIDEVNLRAMGTMRSAFGCPVGFSDHTAGVGASPWAVALGANVVEKHFTLDRSLPGPDHQASLEPEEFEVLVQQVRAVEAALGDGIKRTTPSEMKNKVHMQKSIAAARPIAAGQLITEDDLACKRPGSGLAPHWMDLIVGNRAASNITADTLLTLAHVCWET